MIAALPAGFAASPWMRAALRYVATALDITLSPPSFRRVSERKALSPISLKAATHNKFLRNLNFPR